MGISQQEDVHRPEIPLGKTREIDNKARISKKAEMKRKLNRNQKRITPRDIQLSSLTSLIETRLVTHFSGYKAIKLDEKAMLHVLNHDFRFFTN